jgi:hypothetical protein
MKTFIRVVEIWVPDRERTLLEFGGGLYGNTRAFGAVSRSMCFGRGEGLPGQAWEQGRPIILKQLEGSYFRRGRAAAAEGLTCAIALPVFAGTLLNAVLVIFCGDDEQHVGAIELWHNDAANSPELVLDEGYYGGTAELFEFMSRSTRFRRGFGLPGLAWESGLPLFVPDLGKGTRFLRADSATKVGINRGFAIPCPASNGDTYVMAFLSALATPIVRRFETWVPDAAQRHLQRTQGFCELQGALEGDGGRVEVGEGALGRVLQDGRPALAEQAGNEPGAVGAAARGAALQSLVALPVMRDGRLAAVVAWYF